MPFLTKDRIQRAGILLAFLAGLGVAALGYSYFVEPSRLVVTRAEIEVSNWNRAFEGLKIVAISDIHGGSNGGDAAKIDLVVQKANEENPDLIVILGDFISETRADRTKLKMPIDKIAELLRPLKARYGVYAVLGNHDIWNDPGVIAKTLESNGIEVLEHEVATIDIGGADLRLLGLKDHVLVDEWAVYSRGAKRAVDTSKGTGDIIALSHSPDMIRLVTGNKHKVSDQLKVFLAGHTHGGQIWLPIIGSPVIPSSYGQQYARGHITERGVEMFVTSGVGTSILPFRFLVPPEIAVLTIRNKVSEQ
ncbi:MAG: metallophosphoesterase [Acidobacteria bacterium]|nr:MAG: metallophosphoesterase [Acidobacteriota bacterium]REK01526.1 MAG: metallophosphoesterase [Acidobacteriota bacterium]REK14482.1 MAG: metallophosphoesterase [Acidobacteriota bacterium]REK45197.1 MAG: metallophosphoesterase [Acidobacteriota bacterium]